MVSGALAQNPNIINNVQGKMSAVQQQQTQQSNEALGIPAPQASAQANKPPAGSASSAAKPAIVSVTKTAPAAKPLAASAATPAVKSTAALTPNSGNKLEKVNVSHHADNVQIEIESRESLTPVVTKLTSPDRLLVELPATGMATAESKIPVGSNGVKAVRIGMNSKTPPTTSIVVDLDHAENYEISPGPSSKFVLTLHAKAASQTTAQVAAKIPAAAPVKTQAAKTTVAKSSSATVTPKISISANAAVAPKAATAPKGANATTTAKTTMPAPIAKTSGPKLVAASASATAKTPAPAVMKSVAVSAAPSAKLVASPSKTKAVISAAPKSTSDDRVAPIGATADASKAPKPEDKKWAMTGKRDPFFSPVVQQTSGSGCSTGKKCLEIGQINVRGIVKSQEGFIAVVTNSLNKAYFLHENDPVFNGYVEKITGDSVVFQETYQDNLGKPVSREVTKKVSAPVV